MNYTSETKALNTLAAIRNEFASKIRENFEHKAKACSSCETPGACCLDEHFVNVRISRIEAVAIKQRLESLIEASREQVYARVERAIEAYGLADSGDTYQQTYACPLYEKGTGCLVHDTAKPLPCIAHACYKKKEDLPPGELLAKREIEVDKLNERVYGKPAQWLPIPVAIRLEQ